jgi:hypothetical protein
MALQTRFVALFRGDKKTQGGAGAEEVAAPSSPDAASPSSELSGISEPAPRRSSTQYVSGIRESAFEGGSATPQAVSPLPPFLAWDRAAGADAVTSWLDRGAGAAGARALSDVISRLSERVPPDRWDRTGDLRAVVAELAPLLAVLEVPQIYARLLAVGLPACRGPALRTLVLAFIQLEATGRDLDVESSCIVESACLLRADLVAACTWNLRGQRSASALARITQSVNASELSLDLTELAELLSTNESAFRDDASFSAREACERALSLACKLKCLVGQRFCSVTGERELSAQVFSLLMECVTEIQTAGVYGLRHSPNWARAFGPLWNVCRPRSRLRSALGG